MSEVEGLEILFELFLHLDVLIGQDLLHGNVHRLCRRLVQDMFQDPVEQDGVDLVLLQL